MIIPEKEPLFRIQGRMYFLMKNVSFLRSVSNALAVLEVLGECTETGMGVSQVARKLGLGKSSCHRLLVTLESKGFVRQNPETGKYLLGAKTIILAGKYLDSLQVYEICRPVLQTLAEQTGETAHVAVLDGDKALFISKVDSKNPFRMISYIGWRAPLHCTALGKVLLAFAGNQDLVNSIPLEPMTPKTIVDRRRLTQELESIRRRGWSMDDEESQLGLRCYAAPIRNHRGEVIAAVSVSGPVARNKSTNKDFVLQAAQEISLRLGYAGSSEKRWTYA